MCFWGWISTIGKIHFQYPLNISGILTNGVFWGVDKICIAPSVWQCRWEDAADRVQIGMLSAPHTYPAGQHTWQGAAHRMHSADWGTFQLIACVELIAAADAIFMWEIIARGLSCFPSARWAISAPTSKYFQEWQAIICIRFVSKIKSLLRFLVFSSFEWEMNRETGNCLCQGIENIFST